jgi:hypothetical protein
MDHKHLNDADLAINVKNWRAKAPGDVPPLSVCNEARIWSLNQYEGWREAVATPVKVIAPAIGDQTKLDVTHKGQSLSFTGWGEDLCDEVRNTIFKTIVLDLSGTPPIPFCALAQTIFVRYSSITYPV